MQDREEKTRYSRTPYATLLIPCVLTAATRPQRLAALGNDRAGAFHRFLLSDLECSCEIFSTLRRIAPRAMLSDDLNY